MAMPSGHLVICHAAQTLLVNTGCPVSIGTRPSFAFLDQEIPVLERYHGMTVAQWSEIIGINIDGVLGSDFLGRRTVTIDPDAGRVVFDGDPPGLRAATVPVDTVAGMPVLQIRLAQERLRVLLHTGATLSCLRDVDIQDQQPLGVVRDRYPGLGEFTTELRRVPLGFGDQVVSLECGVMPAPLERALSVADVHGVVGTNLFRTHTLGWSQRFSGLRLAARETIATRVRRAAFDKPQQLKGLW